MKKIDSSTVLSICSALFFVAGIITFVFGDNNTMGFLFTTNGLLFLTIGINLKRQAGTETQNREEKADEEENK